MSGAPQPPPRGGAAGGSGSSWVLPVLGKGKREIPASAASSRQGSAASARLQKEISQLKPPTLLLLRGLCLRQMLHAVILSRYFVQSRSVPRLQKHQHGFDLPRKRCPLAQSCWSQDEPQEIQAEEAPGSDDVLPLNQAVSSLWLVTVRLAAPLPRAQD